MPSAMEPSDSTASGSVPKPFGYFFAGLIVGAVCVLLPFLFVLPIALNQAHAGDQLQMQLALKEAEIARLQMQRRPPPPPPTGFYPPPPPGPDNAGPRPQEHFPSDGY